MKSSSFRVPISTVDICIFTAIDLSVKVLIHKRVKDPLKGKNSLPGGFVYVDQDEDLDETARRVLFNKTGVKGPYLEQVKTIGNRMRDPRGWAITTLYFSLVDSSELDISQGDWVDIKNIGQLAFDHNELVNLAIERLQSKSSYTALPLSLLPKSFTLFKAQEMFELILNHKQEKKAFRKRLLDNDCVLATDLKVQSGKRSALLYKINKPYSYEFPRSLKKNILEL